MKNKIKISQICIALIPIANLYCMASLAAPPPPPTVDVKVTNTPAEPVPVNVIATPETSVMCFRELLLTVAPGPIGGGFSSFSQTAITCPNGVERVDVQRITFSPDIGGAGTTTNIAKYRITVSFTDALGEENLAGFVAILTEGAPAAAVTQNFRIDTTGTDAFINLRQAFTPGIDTYNSSLTGTLYFVGTPVP